MTFFDVCLLLISYFSEAKIVIPKLGGSYVISVYNATHCGQLSLVRAKPICRLF